MRNVKGQKPRNISGVDFSEFLDQYGRLAPRLIRIDGAVFNDALGSGWAQEHERVPFLLTPDELEATMARDGMEPFIIARAMERYLSDVRAFHDQSRQSSWIRHAYRDLFPVVQPAIFRDLNERMSGAAQDTEDFLRAALTMLCLWPGNAREDPDAWKVWFFAGWSLRQIGDDVNAESFLDQSVQLNPRCAPALVELGGIKALRNQTAEAAALFDRARDAEPDNVSALSNAAGSRLQAGRIDEALLLLQKAKLLEPDDPFVDKLLRLAQERKQQSVP